MWFLARAKLTDGKKYYGAYLGGFPERARAMLGVNVNDPVLHVCGGMAKHYPYRRGFCEFDQTMDIDPNTKPDIEHDVNKPFPLEVGSFKAFLCDPPYSEADATHYDAGSINYPKPNQILKNCFEVMTVGQRVGIIHYILPKAPKESKFIAAVGVCCGFNNRIRVYSVFEKI